MKIKKHYLDIKRLGVLEFLRKLRVLSSIILNKLIILFIVLPSFIFFFLLSRFVIFRFGIIRSSRIGHFIANTEIYLAEKKMFDSRKKKYIDIISFDNVSVSNLYLSEHYKKEIKIYPNLLVQPFYNFINYFKKLKKFNINTLGSHGDRDLNGYLYKVNHSFKFNSKYEIDKINIGLKNLGLTEKSKFICLNVRDDAYLKKTYPRGDWNYHNYRNWDIKKFNKVSNSLTKRGYKVLRMGKIVKEKIDTSNPMIIDYANSSHKSDIMDIYLHTKSFFTATTGTGVDLGSYVSRVPMAWISVPVSGFYTFKNHYHVTKHHKNKKTGKKLTLSEIFSYGEPTNERFLENVTLEELSDIEIDEFLLEVLDSLENKGIKSDEENLLNLKFWENYKRLIKINNLNHLHKNYDAIFSPNFLKKNPELLN